MKFETKNIGKAYVKDSKLVYFEKHYRENLVHDYVEEKGKGCLMQGIAGSGKHTRLCSLVMSSDNPLVLSFTNKAVENIRKKLS